MKNKNSSENSIKKFRQQNVKSLINYSPFGKQIVVSLQADIFAIYFPHHKSECRASNQTNKKHDAMRVQHTARSDLEFMMRWLEWRIHLIFHQRFCLLFILQHDMILSTQQTSEYIKAGHHPHRDFQRRIKKLSNKKKKKKLITFSHILTCLTNTLRRSALVWSWRWLEIILLMENCGINLNDSANDAAGVRPGLRNSLHARIFWTKSSWAELNVDKISFVHFYCWNFLDLRKSP